MMQDVRTKYFNKTINGIINLMTKQSFQDLDLIIAYHAQAQSKITQQKAQEAFRQARDALPEYKDYQHALEIYRQDRNQYAEAKANIDKEVREFRASEDIVHEFAEVNE